METLRICINDDETLGWTTRWFRESHRGHELLAIPKLHLSYDATMALCGMIPYPKLFQEAYVATLDVPDVKYYLAVIHAHFTLWENGNPGLVGNAFVLTDKPQSLAFVSKDVLGSLISKGAEMLR